MIMTIYKGSTEITEIYKGSQKISNIYVGSQEVFGSVDPLYIFGSNALWEVNPEAPGDAPTKKFDTLSWVSNAAFVGNTLYFAKNDTLYKANASLSGYSTVGSIGLSGNNYQALFVIGSTLYAFISTSAANGQLRIVNTSNGSTNASGISQNSSSPPYRGAKIACRRGNYIYVYNNDPSNFFVQLDKVMRCTVGNIKNNSWSNVVNASNKNWNGMVSHDGTIYICEGNNLLKVTNTSNWTLSTVGAFHSNIGGAGTGIASKFAG